MKHQITITPGEHRFDEVAASRIVEQIKAKPDSVIGLSTGRTTYNMHRRVAQIWQQTGFDASHTTFFGLDEVVGVSNYLSPSIFFYLPLSTKQAELVKVF